MGRGTGTGCHMIEAWQAILLVLLALVVGIAVPVLLQLRRTLRRLERFLDETGPRLNRTLDQTDEAAARIDRIGAEVEDSLRGLRDLAGAASGLGSALRQVQDSARAIASIGGALGPAIVAAVRALFAPAPDDARDPTDATPPAHHDRPAGPDH